MKFAWKLHTSLLIRPGARKGDAEVKEKLVQQGGGYIQTLHMLLIISFTADIV